MLNEILVLLNANDNRSVAEIVRNLAEWQELCRALDDGGHETLHFWLEELLGR